MVRVANGTNTDSTHARTDGNMLLHTKTKAKRDNQHTDFEITDNTTIVGGPPALVRYACVECGDIVELGVGDPIRCSHDECNSRIVRKLRSTKPLEYVAR